MSEDLRLINDLRSQSPDTLCLEAATHPTHYDGLAPFVAFTSIYQLRDEDPSGHVYSRLSNPTTSMLEHQIEHLYRPQLLSGGADDARDDADVHRRPLVVACASGMAAISTVMEVLTAQPTTEFPPLGAEDRLESPEGLERYERHVLISDELYFVVYWLLETIAKEKGVIFDRFDVRDIEGAVAKVRHSTCLVYFESCSNPSMKIPDFDALIGRIRKRKEEKLAEFCQESESESESESVEANFPMRVVVDNTWMTALLFNPFSHGADVVVESGSKYLCGSSSTIYGIIVSSNRIDSDKFWNYKSLIGCQPGPMASYLVSKGLETLPIRMERLSKTAFEIAQFLLDLPFVPRAVHPQMPQHGDHKLAQKYFRDGSGSGIVFFHAFLSKEEGEQFMGETTIWKRTTSFGGSHYLLGLHPKKGTTSKVAWNDVEREDEDEGEAEEADEAEFPGTWYRLSVGLTSCDDAKRDIARALCRHASDELGKMVSFDRQSKSVQWKKSETEGKRSEEIPPERPLAVGSLVVFLPEAESRETPMVVGSVESDVVEEPLSGSCVVCQQAAKSLEGVDLSLYRLMKVRSV